MITLFRRIREKLIASGSFSKYMLYAMGEILLVVFGILIALQVSNWNEERKGKILTEEYRLRLLDDMYEELAVIESVLAYGNVTMKYANDAIEVFESEDLDKAESPDQFLIDLYQASQIQEVAQSSATYEELLSSGQIRKIEKDSLRASIISYYKYNWTKSVIFTLEDPYRENIRKEIPSSIQSKIRAECGDRYEKKRNTILVTLPVECPLIFDEQLSQTTALAILNTPSLRKDLRYRIGNLEGQLYLVENFKGDLETIITELEKEL